MVPEEGIEPPTFGLQNRCSTAELFRQCVRHIAGSVSPRNVLVNPAPLGGTSKQGTDCHQYEQGAETMLDQQLTIARDLGVAAVFDIAAEIERRVAFLV